MKELIRNRLAAELLLCVWLPIIVLPTVLSAYVVVIFDHVTGILNGARSLQPALDFLQPWELVIPLSLFAITGLFATRSYVIVKRLINSTTEAR